MTTYTAEELFILTDLDDGGSLEPARLAGLVRQAGRINADPERLASLLRKLEAHAAEGPNSVKMREGMKGAER